MTSEQVSLLEAALRELALIKEDVIRARPSVGHLLDFPIKYIEQALAEERGNQATR